MEEDMSSQTQIDDNYSISHQSFIQSGKSCKITIITRPISFYGRIDESRISGQRKIYPRIRYDGSTIPQVHKDSWEEESKEKLMIFTNFSVGDLTNGIFLLIKVIEFKTFASDKNTPPQYLKVLHGITGVSGVIKRVEFEIIPPSDYQLFSRYFHINRIEKMTKDIFDDTIQQILQNTLSENATSSIEISVKKFNCPLFMLQINVLQLKEEMLESNVETENQVKCTLAKNYINESLWSSDPDFDINEYYMTLNSADFRSCNNYCDLSR
ncbi:hypothetical protein RF11_13360 [Thelohanellus kitauei]|uniref:Uncharacterized protein n=1 Tax=Thelohanellus kitauei TaxID=669202 RepID=A0A0C2JGA6_THEKT|nr:hypothetical protein RF11_13360 [Thelohanellus kitauei]